MKKLTLSAILLVLCATMSARVYYLLPPVVGSTAVSPQEERAMAWFEQFYGATYVAADSIAQQGLPADLTTLWVNIDRTNLSKAAFDACMLEPIEEALNAYVAEGGNLYLSGQATRLVYRIGRARWEPEYISNGYENGNDTWSVCISFCTEGNYRHHALYNYMQNGEGQDGLSAITRYPLVSGSGTYQRTNNNCGWGDWNTYAYGTGGCDRARRNGIERGMTCRVLGGWGHTRGLDYAGIIEFLPTADYAGRVIANGLAANQWSLQNTSEYNVANLAHGALEYLENPTEVEMPVTLSDTLSGDGRYLQIPIQDDAAYTELSIYRGAELLNTHRIRLAQDTVQRYLTVGAGEMGEALSIEVAEYYPSSHSLDSVRATVAPEVFVAEEENRPTYHYMPPYGWMNDPNGLVYANGVYHLFYQYHPYSIGWNDMHWGHATSIDLIHWQHEGVALFPLSNGTAFSGSIVADVNNTAGFGSGAFVALYTLNGSNQTQRLAYSTDEGRTWHEHGTVLSNPGKVDFRDPKVFWHDAEGCWIMSLAVGPEVWWYRSANLQEWIRLRAWGGNVGSHAGVWECPDMIEVPVEGTNETKWVLLVSLNGGTPNGGSGTQYFVGDFVMTDFVLEDWITRWIDFGKENYAGVTWSGKRTDDGKPIFIGWMNNWNYAGDLPATTARSQMTLPRALSLRHTTDGYVLCSRPVDALQSIMSDYTAAEIDSLSERYEMEDVPQMEDGTYVVDLALGVEKKSWELQLRHATNGQNFVIGYEAQTNRVYTDRRSSGKISFNADFAAKRHYQSVQDNEIVSRVRVVVDKRSAEVFFNGGRLVSSSMIYPLYGYNKVVLLAKDGDMQVKKLRVIRLSEEGGYEDDPEPEASALGNQNAVERAEKMLRDHRLLLRIDSHVYDVLGRKVK